MSHTAPQLRAPAYTYITFYSEQYVAAGETRNSRG